MAIENVLATDLLYGDDADNPKMARRGDKLPAELKDSEEQYLADGVLAPEHLVKLGDENPLGSLTLSEVRPSLLPRDPKLNEEELNRAAEARHAAGMLEPRSVTRVPADGETVPVNEPETSALTGGGAKVRAAVNKAAGGSK